MPLAAAAACASELISGPSNSAPASVIASLKAAPTACIAIGPWDVIRESLALSRGR